MRVMQVAERAVAIWFVEEDAPPRRNMLTLVRSALKASGYAPWRSTEAECFSAGNETLLIARPEREADHPSDWGGV